MSIKIVDKRVKYDRVMSAIMRGVRKASVKVGVDNRPHPKSKLSTDEIGTIHEFGLGPPQRLFLRDYVDGNEAGLIRRLNQAINDVISGKEVGFLEAMRGVGNYAVKGILGRIKAGILPELSPRTVRNKGHYLPLVETHAMTDAIVYEVEGMQSLGVGAFEAGNDPLLRPEPLAGIEEEFSAETVRIETEKTVGDVG